MQDQKLDNVLNLSMDVTSSERIKSRTLAVGYDQAEKTWEVIVKYSGDIASTIPQTIMATKLFGGYAILRLTREELDTLSDLPVIEYIEMPKRLYFSLYDNKYASCIPPVQEAPLSLSGKGTLVGILDSGIDIFHPDFIREDGTSMIRYLWDQTIEGEPPKGYHIGTLYTNEQINEAIKLGRTGGGEKLVPSRDVSGHGTGVASIAAGNGRASQGRQRGVAYQSELVVVKLRTPLADGFPSTTELMQGLNFLVESSIALRMPIAINVSFGNNYGSHWGSSLIESFFNVAANVGRNVISVGTGNEGNRARHTSGHLSKEAHLVEFVISEGEASLNVQLWKNYSDDIDVTIISPSGKVFGPLQQRLGTSQFEMEGVKFLVYYGTPAPYSIQQEIFIEMIPSGDSTILTSGIWSISLVPIHIVDGLYNMWLPAGSAIGSESGFLEPTQDKTLTIPSTAASPITVGAYDARTLSEAPFSGRGFIYGYVVKPEIVAPGVNVLSAAVGGGYAIRTGTSMATPFVTGAAALLMEWGIVNGNDSYLYGQKVKAYLIKGARPLPGMETPNSMTGWGALCVKDSLPV